MSRPRRQEQEPAREEVVEVAPDVLRMELPIRMPGLGHVNCYALVDAEGAAVVDPGLPGPASWRALVQRLGRAGLEPRHVHTVIITHSHPDHFGGAARFAKLAGSKVVAHRAFRFGPLAAEENAEVSVDDLAAQRAEGGEHGADGEAGEERRAARREPPPAAPERKRAPWQGTTPWGGRRPRPSLRARLRWRLLRLLGTPFLPPITHPVRDGDRLRLAGREWRVVHTPGHTEDHFCLHDPESRIFLAGDHVLPTITPHISGLSSSADPLDAFFDSLDRVAALEHVDRVLPAHGHPFDDLRARAEAIKRHHDERLARVVKIGGELGAATVEAFSRRLFKPRSWGEMAESETYAHLEHLRHAGRAERREDAGGRYLYVTG